jgi:hypothetical protein
VGGWVVGGGVESEFSDQLWLWPSRTIFQYYYVVLELKYYPFMQFRDAKIKHEPKLKIKAVPMLQCLLAAILKKSSL